MFVNHLSGDDEVGWKYVMLAKDLFSRYETLNNDRLRTLMLLMYPYRYVRLQTISSNSIRSK
jgi:hypothetical protein